MIDRSVKESSHEARCSRRASLWYLFPPGLNPRKNQLYQKDFPSPAKHINNSLTVKHRMMIGGFPGILFYIQRDGPGLSYALKQQSNEVQIIFSYVFCNIIRPGASNGSTAAVKGQKGTNETGSGHCQKTR